VARFTVPLALPETALPFCCTLPEAARLPPLTLEDCALPCPETPPAVACALPSAEPDATVSPEALVTVVEAEPDLPSGPSVFVVVVSTAPPREPVVVAPPVVVVVFPSCVVAVGFTARLGGAPALESAREREPRSAA
jgi:hypothetical protein